METQQRMTPHRSHGDPGAVDGISQAIHPPLLWTSDASLVLQTGKLKAQGEEGTGTGVACKTVTKVNLSQEARFLLLPDSPHPK